MSDNEKGYLELIEKILKSGVKRDDRTNTGTLSIFGPQIKFNLLNNVLPIITTKKVIVRSIIEELLWFIKGSTNGEELSKKNVHIWKANGSRQYLDSIGLVDREENDLGPIYGFQWRFAGADYTNCHDDYTGKGFDQLKNVIETIKARPYDRRLLIVSWNVKDLPKMALPPCHCLVQFYVAEKKLSCKLYQRSADLGLGVPFNITSYALLTHMIAHVCGLEAHEFIHSFGDTHIYLNHIEQLSEQIKREPYEFPTVKFARPIKNIEDFTYEDLIIENYKHHPKLEMKMAI